MVRDKLPYEMKSEETKRKIWHATEDMLSKYDFKHLTVRNICEEAGVAYGSFYHHFTSKENLLYLYTKNLYQKVKGENPLPEWINATDYIKCILWHIVVYGSFCEVMGKNLIRYLYQNCPQDLFEDTFREEIIPTIHEANLKGMIDPGREKIYNRPAEELLVKDLEIVEKGAIAWWSTYSSEDSETLHETLEHLIFNMLYSYCSEQYRNSDYLHKLLTERETFQGSIKMDGINLRQNI
ncbi:MAG: TetR/AcrR family transcriptional regulator [Clostridiales bacterium]|nr:TetR/AcrR family transcriptional regulator [Clostridiales bacterium]